MITAQLESASHTLVELQKIFPDHWKELALNQDKVPLDPMYEVYLEREKSGSLVYATVREDGKIIGYFVGFVSPSLHYRGMICCTPDIFYVVSDKRGLDAGTILFNFVKSELKRRGVRYWIVGDKDHKPARGFLKMMGFNKIEEYHAMWLGE